MTKYFKIEYNQLAKINNAITTINSSKVKTKINSIKDVERQVPMWEVQITNITSNENEVDYFIDQLKDCLR